MAQQIVNNGDTGLVSRNKINENFTEVYAATATPLWIDDSGTTKPAGGAPVEVVDIEAIGEITGATAKIGDAVNNTEFEADGTIKFNGDATVFDDINTDVTPRNTGTGRPTLLPMIGNIQVWSFDLNDFADLTPIEFPHGWKEGSEMEIHLHWATDHSVGADNDVRVRWEIEYTWANTGRVFPVSTVASAQTTIPAGTSAYTHFFTQITTFTPVGGLIGAQLCWRLKHVPVTSGVQFTGNPFVLSIGVHYEKDTLGSRERATK